MSIATLATFHGAGYSAVLRAFEDNELNYIGFILQKILLLVFILVAIYLKTGLVGFVVAHLAYSWAAGSDASTSSIASAKSSTPDIGTIMTLR
jgi:hypothetical protein